MTKHVKLFLAGALPLAMGYVLNFALYLSISGLLMRIMGWIMIFLWFAWRDAGERKNVFHNLGISGFYL